ncbi:MAG: PA2779 family protein [Arenicellales bacterium]
MQHRPFKFFCRLFVCLFLFTSALQPAAAAMVSASELLGHNGVSFGGAPDRIELRQQVVQVLIEHGVSPMAATQRAAALSESELRLIQNKINSLPAGQGALEVIGIVFLVLLILELVGVTNIFNRL